MTGDRRVRTAGFFAASAVVRESFVLTRAF
jgi:hypothetical protein